MKVWGLLYTVVALILPVLVESTPSRHHHRHHHASRHRYSIEGSKGAMDAALQTPHLHLDIRSIKAVEGSNAPVTADSIVRADVVGSNKDVEAFAAAGELHSTTEFDAGNHIRAKISRTSARMKVLKHQEYNEDAVVAKDRGEVVACLERTDGCWDELKQTGQVYTNSSFFECFRPSHEIFDFLDILMEQNAQFITKYENVSVTYEGRAIPAFKISTSKEGTKKTLYTQALIHAREWQAGAATLYTMASMLDDLRAGNEAATRLFDKIDWYFVPIVNIDGYQYTWEVDRMWRTNRHVVNLNGTIVGVDLNRNWPPNEFFNLDPSDVDEETYPGEHPLSEPATAGLFNFITSLDSLIGILDMHTFGGQVLRPFSNQPGGGAEPFGSRMRALGDSVRSALSTQPDVQYQSETGAYLYKAYGCFDDGMFLQYNLTVPTLTIEVEGGDFVSPQSTIRPVGENVYLGLRQFAHETLEYRKFVEEVYPRSVSSNHSDH
ncbi:Carboxypeptidase [Phytophthora megakarya]|uniref:Carboxypeptidase n=1 Tax=Phytophthora megakarya TaxID=4795 RepID=A0A225VRN2_9STRA|nr:Carboxypeptidase [Phytophthora megakarya]